MSERNTRFVRRSVLGENRLPIGSSVDVRVSSIKSPSKFWCQVVEKDDTLLLLMQDIQNYYAPQTEEPDELICVVRHPDNGIWYRARLLENHSSPTVDVQFIDYGSTQKVQLKDIRPIDPGFLQLKAQAFQCCLENVTSPTSLSPPSRDYSSSEFQAFVDAAASSNVGLKCTVKDVINDPQGAALNVVDIETPFQSACKLLAQRRESEASMGVHLPPVSFVVDTSEVRREEKVLISCSEGVDNFYGQLERNTHLLDELCDSIQQLCRQPQSTDNLLVTNNICIAKYTDNRWYRGQITATHPKLQVHFVDYGDTLAVKKTDIRPFPAEASRAKAIPVQAIPLKLYNVPANVSKEVDDWFTQIATGSQCTISVVERDPGGKLLVELYDGPLNVNRMVMERISAVRPAREEGLFQHTDHQHSRNPNRKNFRTSQPNCHSEGDVTVLPKMNGIEQRKDEGSSEMFAEGNTNGQATPHNSPSEHDVGAAVNECENQGKRSIRITDLPQRPVKQGLVTEVYVSHFNSPSSFYVQLKKDEHDVYSLVEDLNKPHSSDGTAVKFSDLQIGDLVNAEFPDDCSWYRAVVKSKSEDRTVGVEFIDFGNEAVISCLKIRPLGRHFTERARFSIPCKLQLAAANKTERWNEEAVSMFKRATKENPEKTFACTFIREGEDFWEVCLEDQGVVLAEAFREAVKTESIHVKQADDQEGKMTSKYKMPNISEQQTERVFLSSIVGPQYFWCQYANTEGLDKISILAQEAGEAMLQDGTAPETLDPGSPCLALFDDKKWYRGQVIKRSGATHTVLFIDYGNESEVETKGLQTIPAILLEEAPQAFLCSLAGFDMSEGSWEDSALDEFYDLLVDKPLYVTILKMTDNMESQIPQYTVRLECEEVVVNNLMEKYWKGCAAKDATAGLCS